LLGEPEQYCEPLMPMGKVLPQAGGWDIHPRGKYVFMKKAIQDGFPIFLWSRLRSRKEFMNDLLMKDYINNISYNGDNVRTKGTDGEKELLEVYLTVCNDMHAYF